MTATECGWWVQMAWAMRFKLSVGQIRDLSPAMLWQLCKCKDDEARRILPGRNGENMIDHSNLAFPKPSDVKHKPVAVKVFPDGREVCNLLTAGGKREYRYRVVIMLARQRRKCCLCGQTLTAEDATFEHQRPRGMGGAFRDDRINLPNGSWLNGAAHGVCNGAKGSQRIAYNSEISQFKAPPCSR